MDNIGIVGLGEVGNSLYKLYTKRNIKCKRLDPYINLYDDLSEVHVLNVCIPCVDAESFIKNIENTIKTSSCHLVIVHSSILIGVIEKLKDLFPTKNIVHSPIRGVHPDLTESTETFTKFIGCVKGDIKSLDAAEKHLNSIDIQCHRTTCTSTVLCKLLSTSYYGMCIAFTEHMGRVFDKHGEDFKDVGIWTDTYNDGYKKLGKLNVQRPNLYRMEGSIGGHCVVPNAILLKKMFPEINAWDYILQFKK